MRLSPRRHFRTAPEAKLLTQPTIARHESPKLRNFQHFWTKSEEMGNTRAARRNEEHSNVNRQNILLINFEFEIPPRKELKLGELLIKRTKQKKIRFSLDIWYLISGEKKNTVRGICALRCVFTLSVAVRVPLNKRGSLLIQNFLKGKVKLKCLLIETPRFFAVCLREKQFFLLISFWIPRFWMKSFLRFHCARLGDSEIGNRKRSALISIHLSSDEGLAGLSVFLVRRSLEAREIYVKMSSLSVWLAFNNERSLLWPELSTANCNSRA